MKKTIALLIFNFILFLNIAIAQITVTSQSISLVNPPLLIELMYGTFENTGSSGVNVSVRLVCSSQGQNVANIKTKVFYLPPGITEINLKNADALLCPGNVTDAANNFLNYDIRNSLMSPGNYDFCLFVYSAMGDDLLGKNCFSRNIENLAKKFLLSPENNAKIHTINPVFTWAKVVKNNTIPDNDLHYSLRVVEMLEGQTPETALNTNPVTFSSEPIDISLFQYSQSEPILSPCKQYVWQIEAFKGTGATKKSLIKSEAWSFLLECDGGVTYTPRVDKQPDKPNETKKSAWPPQEAINSINIITAKDALLLQVPTDFVSGSVDVSYTITNLSANKISDLKSLSVIADQNKLKIKIPIDKSNIEKGETGIVTLYFGKEVFYQKFKRP